MLKRTVIVMRRRNAFTHYRAGEQVATGKDYLKIEMVEGMGGVELELCGIRTYVGAMPVEGIAFVLFALHFTKAQFVSSSACTTRSSSHFKHNHVQQVASTVCHIFGTVFQIHHYTRVHQTKAQKGFSHFSMETFDPDNPHTLHFFCPCTIYASFPRVYMFNNLESFLHADSIGTLATYTDFHPRFHSD
jgi:hypothetical protein